MKKKVSILILFCSFSLAELIHPVNESNLNYVHILFEWEQESNANTYNFQLDLTPNFNNPIVDINNESLIYIDTENINWETTYYWRVRSIDINGNIGEWINTLSFSTGSTRSNAYSINYNDNQYSDGITIFSSFFNYYSAMIDQNGNEIWNTGDSEIVYYNTDFNGQLFGCKLDNSLEHNIPGVEFDLESNITWQEPNEDFFHHELIKLKNGNYLGIVEELQPGPIAPGAWSAQFASIGYLADGVTPELYWVGDRIVEWDKDTNEEVWSWSVFDYYSMQDYDIEGETWYQAFYDGKYDWTHINALHPVYDENNNLESIYLSCRHLSRISKVNYETKEIDFNLGREMPSGDVNCGQDIGFSFPHSVTVLDNGNIVTLDNGNLSTLWLDTEYSTSRGLEISITESTNNCEASIEWEYSLPEELFGFASGNVQKLDNGNYLIVTVGDGGTALEVSPQNEHIWEGKLNLQLPNGAVYRASRIPSLHPVAFSATFDNMYTEGNNNYIELDENDLSNPSDFYFTIYNEGSIGYEFEIEMGPGLNIETEFINPGENISFNPYQENAIFISVNTFTIRITPKKRPDLTKEININFIPFECNEEVDECGVCGGPGIVENECDCDGNILDCSGLCGGDLEFDCCGSCGGDNSSCSNCCGLPFNDDCSNDCFTDSNYTCCLESDIDCNGECFGNSIIDECGVCNGDNSSCNQCNEGYTYFSNIPNSTVLLDGIQCFNNIDLNSIIDIINANGLIIDSPINLGTQNWFEGRITRLEVGNYFQGGNVTLHTIPESIGEMENLGVLYFNYNELTQLPNSISALSNLIYLVLSFNQLTSFPENIGNLSQLIWIDAGYNELESIPESIGQLSNLSYLWIFNNNLTSLPNSICNLNINWDGDDFQFLPYFGAGANSLCDVVPQCIEEYPNLNSSIDPLYYSFEITLEQECLDECLIMDVNNDEDINVLDIVNTVNIILGTSTPTNLELCAADANSDNTINVIDIVTIINYIFRF